VVCEVTAIAADANVGYHTGRARVAELADAPDLGSGSERSAGSIPVPSIQMVWAIRTLAHSLPGKCTDAGHCSHRYIGLAYHHNLCGSFGG